MIAIEVPQNEEISGEEKMEEEKESVFQSVGEEQMAERKHLEKRESRSCLVRC